MRILAPELLGIAFFVIAGWAALWPVRERLGAVNYHLAALPTGLLAAPLAACVSTVTGRPLDMVSAAGGALLLVAALWGVQLWHWAAAQTSLSRPSPSRQLSRSTPAAS